MLFESLAYLFLGKYVVQLLYALKSNYLMCVFDGDRALELVFLWKLTPAVAVQTDQFCPPQKDQH